MYNTNPYYFNPYYQQQQNVLPTQQIIQVNGKASVDTIQLAPNSSILVMDTSAPIVWMCVSDGVGKVTSTPYDITIHQEKPPIDMALIEQRLASVETTLAEMRNNYESNASKSKQNNSKSEHRTD